MPQSQEHDVQLKLFRDLLLSIFDIHREFWTHLRGQAKDIVADIAKTYPSFTSRGELEDSLPTEQAVEVAFPQRRFLYLNPTTRPPSMVPVLWLKSDFGRSIPEINLRLGLFLKYQLDTKAIGYRFESPHGPGAHHYYHLQMIRGFGKSTLFLSGDDLNWIPVQSPTIPLDARNPIELLLNLLISLYGLRDTGVFLRDSGLETRTKKYLEMRCHSWPPINWYWKVSKKGSEGYKLHETTDEPKAFRRLNPGFRIEGVTKAFYDSQSKRERRA